MQSDSMQCRRRIKAKMQMTGINIAAVAIFLAMKGAIG